MQNFEEVFIKNVKRQTPTQLADLIYRDHLTGRLNRRAYDALSTAGKFRVLKHALVDLDSLKWINDNLSYRAGDAALCALGAELARRFGDHYVFRIAGDEFAVLHTGNTHRFDCANIALQNVNIFGCTGIVAYSYGLGEDLKEADTTLKQNKKYRSRKGLRASRNQPPPNFKDVALDPASVEVIGSL